MKREPLTPPDGTARVLRFRPRGASSRAPQVATEGLSALPGGSPVADMGRYERPATDRDDYRHRMLVNVLGFSFSVVLVVTGIWLAVRIAELRRDQDCVLAGRRNCAQLSIVGNASRYP